MSLLLFFAGMALLIAGSNWLVDGAASLARRFNISDLVIGLTVVAFGTSSPELIVNLFASFNNNTDIAIGNVVGSNIFNTLVILGLTAIVTPIAVKSTTVWKEIPFSILAVLVMAFMANDIMIDGKFKDIISRIDGFILLGFFSIFMAYTFALAKSSGPLKEVTAMEMGIFKAIVLVITGLAGLFFGGKFLVDGAVEIARYLGISEAVIGLTVVAAGTSMPELATSIVAAFKKKSDIAIGNVVGSNIFNVFFVLGISASIRPIPLARDNSSNFDMFFLIIMSVLLLIFVFSGKEKKINRLEGTIFFLAFVAYTLVLILDTDKSFPFR